MEYDTFAKISVKLRLPCGCDIEILAACDGPPVEDQLQFLKGEFQKLTWYFEDRLPRHKCELVSETNPNGIAPKFKTKEE